MIASPCLERPTYPPSPISLAQRELLHVVSLSIIFDSEPDSSHLLWEMQLPTGDSFSAKAGSCRAQLTASLKRPKLKIIIAQTYLFKDTSNLLTAAMLGCGHDHTVVALQERAASQSEGQDSCLTHRCPVPFEKAVRHPGHLHRNSRDDAGPKVDSHSTRVANGCQADICNS